MYENDIYSGAGAGNNTTGANDGNRSTSQTGNGTGSYYGNYAGGYVGNYSGGSYTNGSADNQFQNAEYRGYQSYQPGGTPVQDTDSGNAGKETKDKKPGGFFRKAILSISLGLFFGLFAGIGFYAVQQSAGMVPGAGSGGQDALVDTNGGNNGGADTDESPSGISLTDTSSIRVVSSDVTDVVNEVMPAMVSIINNYTESTRIFGQNYRQDLAASGSGIIVAESETELLIVSNYHVVADATKLEVSFVDGTVAQAQMKGADSDMDLAVIAIPLDTIPEDTKNAIAIATLGDSDELNMGEPVIAIGNALGYGQSVTDGIVSALNRELTLEDGSTGTFIQTNAAINPGNSGGALLNVSGEVIGINSNKIGGSVVEGMGYAIPISAAKPIIAELMLKETRSKVEDGQSGYIGITMQTVTEQIVQMYGMPQGIYIVGIQEGSPAQEAGILKGDIITKFDGEKIRSHEDLQNVLQYYAPGDTASITVMRPQNGEYQAVELEITLGSRPAENN